MAAAVESNVLTREVELGEIWAAVPDLLPDLVQRMPGLERRRHPRVVYDEYEANSVTPDVGVPPWPVSLLIGGLREGLAATDINDE